MDRVTQMVVTANGKTDTIGYQYDNLNRLTQRSVNNVITAYTYDKAGRLRTITHQGQTTTYNWDAASRLTSKQLPNGVTQSMQYDNANRMTQMTYRKTDNTIIEQITYTFDARGQRTSKTTTNAYPAAQESAYAGIYDNANRLTQLTTKGTGANNTDETFNLTYDINGNMTEKKKADNSDTTTYSWDSQNRLVALARTGTTTLTATFKYDLGNRRIEKTINGVTVKFIYDGDQIVGEQKAGDTTTSVLAGLAIDEMIARYSNGQQSTYLTDALGSVIAQLKDDQTVQNQYGYSPYGMTVKGNNGIADQNADDKGNVSQYTGRENDGTGLYYYRARYYMASCGRFISEDPIGTAGGPNVYAYVQGDPVALRDPQGLFGAADLPAIPCGLADFLTGIADSASFGIGPYLRGLYDIDGGIDTASGSYTAGEVASLGLGLGRLGYASLVAGIRNVPGITGIAANQMRNDLKLLFRGGLFPNARMPSYQSLRETKSEAQIIISASTPNAGVNGAGLAGALGTPINAIANAARGIGGGGCQ